MKMLKLFQSFHLFSIMRKIQPFINENAVKAKSSGTLLQTQSGFRGACSAVCTVSKKLKHFFIKYFCLFSFWGRSPSRFCSGPSVL